MGVIVDVLVAKHSDAKAIFDDFGGSIFKYQRMFGWTPSMLIALLAIYENSDDIRTLALEFRCLYESDSEAVVCMFPPKLTRQIAKLTPSGISSLAQRLADGADWENPNLRLVDPNMSVKQIENWLATLNTLSKRAVTQDLSLLFRASP